MGRSAHKQEPVEMKGANLHDSDALLAWLLFVSSDTSNAYDANRRAVSQQPHYSYSRVSMVSSSTIMAETTRNDELGHCSTRKTFTGLRNYDM